MRTNFSQKLAISLVSILLPILGYAQSDFLSDGASIEIGSSGTLYVNGDIELNGNTTIANEGTVELIGDWYNRTTGNVFNSNSNGWVLFTGANQIIGGSTPTTFNSIRLLGSDNKSLGNAISITHQLDLGTKHLNAALYPVTILNADTGAIITTGGFVYTGTIGALIRHTNTTSNYHFALGEIASGLARPAYFTPSTNTPSILSVELKYFTPSNGGYNINNRDSSICFINGSYYHIAKPLSGAIDYTTRLSYDPLVDGVYEKITAWGNTWDTTQNNIATTGPTLSWVQSGPLSFNATQPLALSRNIATPTISINQGAGYCEGDTLVLSVSPSFIFYDWSNGSVSDTAWALTSGSYNVTVNQAFNCWAVAVPVSVSFDTITIPVLNVAGIASICAGDTLMVAAPAGYASYNWSDGTTNDTAYLTQSGLYSLTVSNGTACLASAASDVELLVNTPIVPVVVAGNTIDICQQDSVELAVLGTFDSYNWQTGGNDSTELVFNNGTYTVAVEDSNGCASTESITISRIDLANPVADFAFVINGTLLELTDQSSNTTQYQWTINGMVVDTLANLNYTLAASGSYSVCLTASNACGSSTACDTILYTGLEQLTALFAEIEVFPNPTTDFVNIRTGKLDQPAQYRVLNILGQEITSTVGLDAPETQVDLRGLAAGPYLLEVASGGLKQAFNIQVVKR